MINRQPVIGITLDWEDSPTYSTTCPWYALRTNYVSIFAKHNAAPILIPYELGAIDCYMKLIDGLVITGGDYDLDPAVYGEERQETMRIVKNNRVEFEIKLIEAALAKNIPILAICAGEQLLAAMHGGKLYQDILAANPNALQHEQICLNIHMSKPSHTVTIIPGTLLHSIVKSQEIFVNSSHHQAVESIGPEMVVSGISSADNIIEAIELPSYSFVLGVEWHPEYEVSEHDTQIIAAFVKASGK